MKMHGPFSLALLLVSVLVSLLGCRPPGDSPDGQALAAMNIECQSFYRPSVGQAPGDGTLIHLAGQGDRGTTEYADMVFEVHLSDDPGEGPALSLSITTKDGDAQILRQLYQIDRVNGLHNQFIGGHGFTGLVYAYHPISTAELQFFCGVDAQ